MHFVDVVRRAQAFELDGLRVSVGHGQLFGRLAQGQVVGEEQRRRAQAVAPWDRVRVRRVT
ncbi:hypothetical protein AHiyo4_37040 [Arthrobacter sp. Hiyo4]|nr:hypothetical protein AHiyo4_37040 [Arthrobacter sp. Hiyo4]